MNTRPRINPGENLGHVLFSQVNGICPKCTLPLMYEKTKKKYKGYDVAHIYPLNPTAEERRLLQGEERLNADLNHEDNLILLCPGCHGKFDKPRTVVEYRQMVAIKKHLIAQSAEREVWHQYTLEDEISSVIAALTSAKPTKSTGKLSYDPKPVATKTDSTLTELKRQKIINNVNDYFHTVRAHLKALDTASPGKADKIALQVRHYYLSLKIKKQTQLEVYNHLVHWLQQRTKAASPDACEVIISFFVQDCEVFE